MKFSFSLTLVFLILVSCSDSSEKGSLTVTRQPAEFETLDAIWLIWPEVDQKKGESVQDVTVSIIDALINEIEVIVTCRSTESFRVAKEVLNNHFPKSDNLTVIELPSFGICARDMGPIFVETNQNTLAIADFNFNAWGYSDTLDPDVKLDEMYNVRVAELLKLPVISSTMISEGGNREVNGKGVLMTTESVELGRNPTMSKQELEGSIRDLWV